MAEYRLCYKKGKKGYAQNHAEYIMRENGYKGKEDLVYKESGNMPVFVDESNVIDFWVAADLYERENSNAYREFELNIPNELNHEQAKQLIQNFVKKELGNQPYSFAIHEEKKDGVKNLHCHLMFSERSLDGIERSKDKYFKRANHKNIEKGGAKKNEYFKQTGALKSLRKSWEVEQNEFLENLGINARVDCRSLKDRRLEALEKNDIELAESLDRNPVNISKNIANKVKYQGEEKLSELEKEKYNEFKENKSKKYSNERLLEIKKGNIIPSEKECKSRLEHLEKKNIDQIAINIISKGEHKRLESRINSIKIDFNDIDSFKKIREDLENKKVAIELDGRATKKYKSLTYFLKQDLQQEKELYSKILETKYDIKVEKEIEQSKVTEISKEEYQKLYDKYSKYTVDKLEFRRKEIDHENPLDRAKAIITNYRRESLISNSLIYRNELKNYEQRKLSQQSINADVTNINKQISKVSGKLSFIDEEYTLLNKKIDNSSDKIEDLKSKIIVQNNIEKIVINNILKEKGYEENHEFEDRIKKFIKIESEYQKTERSFEYFSQNNGEEKYNRALYNINKKLEILSKEKAEYNQEFKSLDSDKAGSTLKNIKEENRKVIDTSKIRVEKLVKAKEHLKKIKDDSVVKKLTINKMTNGNFMKVYREKLRLSKEINGLKKEIDNLGRFDIMKKSKISSEISKKTELYNKHFDDEQKMIKANEQNPNYSKCFSEIKNNIIQSMEKIDNKLTTEKAIINEKIREVVVINKISKKENIKIQNKQHSKLQQVKNTGTGASNNSKNLSKIIDQIERENENSHGNNLDLNLKEEQECAL
ncbi:MobA/MobL family protein [Fusobacterium sp. PH5-44]|uniref:MobA/MobL family protein n=1 Tax=unclassified Fusobacterium TaxID=2648384 RepID=UPI003D1F531D